MAAEQWARLQQEQEKAIHESEARIKQLDKYRADYAALKDRLTTLPEQISHDIMVPFGDLAFMPGKIYHTNEVLVLLGDNWFTETSAHHAVDIVGRRIEGVDEQIQQLKQQDGLLQPRKNFTQELQRMAKDQEDFVEIKEEYNEEKEKQLKERRRQKKSPAASAAQSSDPQAEQRAALQARARQVAARVQAPATPPHVDSEHEEKMKQLDELLMQERRERQLTSTTVDDTDFTPVPTNYPPRHPTGKTVRWRDDNGEEDDWCTDDEDEDDDDDEDSDDYEEEEDEEEEDNDSTRLPRVIKVTFTKDDTTERVTEETQQDVDIISPRDIYKKFVEPFKAKPKSILKRSSSKEEEPDRKEVLLEASESAKGDRLQSELPASAPPPSTAFGDTVREKVTPNQMVASLCASLDEVDISAGNKKTSSNTAGAGKKMSKFKQRQMQGKK